MTAPSSPVLTASGENGSLNGSCAGSFRYSWNPYSPTAHVVVSSAFSSAASNVSAEEPSVLCSSDAEEDEDVTYALGLIARLRREQTDAALQQTIARLPPKTHAQLLAAIEADEELLLELLRKERGNIVAQLIATIGGENCANLVNFVLARAVELATNQSGCIAFSRVFEGATPDQQRQMCAAVVANLALLCSDQYGNYVVQCILKRGDAQLFAAVRRLMITGGALAPLCANKFGSHVAEAFVQLAPPAEVFEVVQYFCGDEALIQALAVDRFGNYFVQNLLRRMHSLPCCAELTQWAMAHIPALVEGTPFAPNIKRALGVAPPRRANPQGQHGAHARTNGGSSGSGRGGGAGAHQREQHRRNRH